MFKVDSGANVIIAGDHNPPLKYYTLQPSSKQFKGARQHPTAGPQAKHDPRAILQMGERYLKEYILVTHGQKLNLLSKMACEELYLLTPTSIVFGVDEENIFRREFPDRFKGLGCLKTNITSYRSLID